MASLWKRLGEAADAFGTAASPTLAWEVAKAWKGGDDRKVKLALANSVVNAKRAANATGALGSAVNEALPLTGVRRGVAGGAEWLLDNSERPLRAVESGLVTGSMAANRWTAGESLFDRGTWRRAEEDAEGVTFGQALLSEVGEVADDTNVSTDEAVPFLRPGFDVRDEDQRTAAFSDDLTGKIASGAVDVVKSIALDPLTYATAGYGKAAKAAKIVKDGELGQVLRFGDEADETVEGFGAAQRRLQDENPDLDVDEIKALAQEQVDQGLVSPSLGDDLRDAQQADLDAAAAERNADGLSLRGRRQRRQIDAVVKRLDGMSAAERVSTRMFDQTTDSGVLAYAFGQTDQITDDVARNAAQRNVLAAAMGHRPALDALKEQDARLSEMVREMTSDIDELRVASADDGTLFGWQQHFDAENDPARLKSLEDRRDELDEAIRQGRALRDLGESAGGITRIEAGDVRGKAARITAVVNTDNRSNPIAVVTGKRLPNSFSVTDNDATDIFVDYLARTRRGGRLDPVTRKDYADRFVTASPAARGVMVREAEDRVFAGLAEQYFPGSSKAEVEGLLVNIRGRKQQAVKNMQARAYSSQDDSQFIRVREDGEDFAVDKGLFQRDTPQLSTQLSDDVSLIDPVDLEAAFKQASRANGGSLAGILVRNAVGAYDFTEAGAAFLNRTWKLGALLRGAYIPRQQIDTQARLMATLGTAYFTLAARGGKNLLANTARRVERDRIRSRLSGVRPAPIEKARVTMNAGTFKRTLDDGTEVEFDMSSVKTMDDMHRLADELAEGVQSADFLAGASEHALRGMRATGQFEYIRGTQAQWMDSYLRVVNRQYAGDPVARMLMSDLPQADAVRWLRSTPEGRAHFAGFKDAYAGPEELVSRVSLNVNKVLPAGSAVRGKLAGSGDTVLTKADVEKAFPNPAERPTVQGEQLVEINDGNFGAQLVDKVDGFASRWYEIASNLPEEVLGRHPYFQARYAEHVRTGADRLIGAVDEVTPRALENVYAQAAKQARKDMGNTLYDVARQSNVAHSLRFLSPFYSAWEDTMVKWSKIIGQDPLVGLNFVKMGQAPNRIGMVQDDEGNLVRPGGYVVDKDGNPVLDDDGKQKRMGFMEGRIILNTKFLPGTWAEDNGWADVRIDKNSLNILFQGDPFWLPGPGPLASVPANELALRVWPEMLGPDGKNYLLPMGTEPELGKALVPAWIRKFEEWQNEDSAAFNNVYNDIASEVAHDSRVKGLDLSDKEIAELAEKKTRNSMMIRFLASNLSPVSVQPGTELAFYTQEYKRLMADNPQTAQEEFFELYPDYWEMAISVTENNTGISATTEAYRATEKYAGDIAQNSEMGAYYAGAANISKELGGTGGEFSGTVYDIQRSQAIGPGTSQRGRTVKDRTDVLKDVQVNKGWSEYNRYMTQLDLALEEAGLTSYRSKAAAPYAEVRKQVVAKLKETYPQWASEFGKRDAAKAENFLRATDEAVKNNPELMKRAEDQTLQDYKDYRAQFVELLSQRKSQSLGAQENADLAIVWEQVTTELRRRDVAFDNWYNRYLETDLGYKPGVDEEEVA